MARSTFSTRAFVTTLLVWSFTALVISGAILFIAPPGRVAHWSGWRLLGLTKSGWQGVHILAAVLFLAAGLFHVLRFNWGAVKAYVRRSREAATPFRLPVILGTVLFAVTVAGTVAEVPPFSTVVELGERATNSWATPDREPPAPHLELQTLERVAASRGVPVEELVAILEKRGMAVGGPGETLLELAERNETTPSALWKILEDALPGRAPSGVPVKRGGGWGRLTVAEAADRVGVDPATALANLRAAGVVATPGDRVRDLASRLGWTPMELVEALASGG